MIGVYFLGCFFLCTVYLTGVLEIFGLLLRWVANFSRETKVFIGILLYLAVAFLFSLPLFALQYIERGVDREVIDNFRTFSLIGYLFSLLMSIIVFRHRHINILRRLGYYAEKRKF